VRASPATNARARGTIRQGIDVAAITLALALCLPGCGSKEPPGEPVQLLTGAMPFDEDECTRNGDWIAQQLLVDPEYGTTFAGWPDTRAPVMWRPGFTGRQVGSEVAVLDPDGNVVATTGRSYTIVGTMLFRTWEPGFSEFRSGTVLSPIGVDMFYACGPVRPAPTGPAPGSQCGLSFPCSDRPTSP
jgi:hypothetical protein